MYGSKLHIALSTLNSSERLAFGKYLKSPFFNHRSDLVKLFQAYLAARNEADLETASIWSALHPRKPLSSTDYNRLCSRLLKLLEGYLAMEAWPERENLERIYLSELYLDRGKDGLAASTLRSADKALGKNVSQGSKHHYARYQLAHSRYNASLDERNRVGKGLHAMSQDLDLWFAIEKLKHACSLAAQLKVSDQDPHLDFLDEVLKCVVRNDWLAIPIVAVYFHAYRMLTGEEGEAEYEALRNLLKEKSDSLQEDEQRTVFLMAINYCIQELNSGRQRYLKEVYDLYQIGLQDGWIFEKGELSPWTYKNVVAAGLKLGDFEGVEAFMEAHREHLPEASRGTFYSYNLAELQFARGEFQACLRTLRYLQFKEALTQLRARILQIKAAYELGEKGLVEYQVANLLKLVRRKKSLAYHRESYRAFGLFAKRLVLLWEEDTAARAALVREIEGRESLVEREWLLGKLR